MHCHWGTRSKMIDGQSSHVGLRFTSTTMSSGISCSEPHSHYHIEFDPDIKWPEINQVCYIPGSRCLIND